MYITKPYYLAIKINYCMIALLVLAFLDGYFLEGLIIILIVLLHEFGHLLVASVYGIKAREIELFPFGGVAKLEGIIGPDPKEEIYICLAGPLLNLILFLSFSFLMKNFSEVYLIDLLFKINLLMFLLNILPIFPLDGGKILRAIVSYFLGFKKATIIMTRITYVISSIIIIVGLITAFYDYNNLYIVALAMFTIMAARNERKMAAFVFIRNITLKKRSLSKRKIMKTHLLVCLKNVTGKEIFDYLLPNKFHVIIVIDENGNCIGEIMEYELINGILSHGIDVTLENLLIGAKKW
ncbi:M50 family metallopeptidase [Brassicibacter mesophilus]|uniref:M50 family metallopeptidase n=1 Tax=Brassicibacter mesophilus TaxID=745119 RepID=UPI003D2191A3